jgi:hypothetical protein
MAIIRIYQDSKGRGVCRSCKASIEWAETIAGKKMPFDPPIVAVRIQGNPIGDARVIEEVDTSVTSTHWATCPDAKSFHRR